MTVHQPKVTVGIDIGTESTKVVLGSAYSCEIVRSDAGLHTTPTAVSFAGKIRNTGETASLKGKNSVVQLNRLLKSTAEDKDILEEFWAVRHEQKEATKSITVEYNGEEKTFEASALLAMLLNSVKKSVNATMKRMDSSDNDNGSDNKDVMFLLTVEPNAPPEVHRQLLDAAFVGGLEQVQIVESPMAYAATYQRKFPDFVDKTALIVDMGHAQTSVFIVKFGGAAATEETTPEGAEGEEKADDEALISKPFTVLSSKSSNSLGAVSLDMKLWHHFQSTMPALKEVTPKSKAGHRLLEGCHKLKHLLSQLPEGKATVENINDVDISLSATRNTVVELCENEATTLKDLLQSAIKEAGLETVDAVETVGGGVRIPWVQAAIQEVFPNNMLSKSLDDTSAALGAALVGESPSMEALVVASEEPSDEDTERRQKLREAEVAMAALDADEKAKDEIRNMVEARILELRSAKHGKNGSLLPSDESLDKQLTSMEDWLFSDEAEKANLDVMKTTWDDMETQVQEMCTDYYAAIDKERKAKEEEMEAAAKLAELERNGTNGEGEEEDHDNRRLPKKRRMEIVMKNKEEANELFKDGNWRFAAARYTKALTHCAKFVDLSPDDIKEVNELKVTLNLNLALAYMKLQNLPQALRVCNEAIALTDGASAKAYYRRASVLYEQKQWETAKKDVTAAKKIADNDKAIQKLGERIELQLKKQKQKEKKMASKMFG